MKNDRKHKKPAPDQGLSRRTLLGSTASLAAASVFTGQAKASSRSALGRPVLVQVFMRLGMDGLTTVVPYGDTQLYNLRPTLAVPPPGQREVPSTWTASSGSRRRPRRCSRRGRTGASSSCTPRARTTRHARTSRLSSAWSSRIRRGSSPPAGSRVT